MVCTVLPTSYDMNPKTYEENPGKYYNIISLMGTDRQKNKIQSNILHLHILIRQLNFLR